MDKETEPISASAVADEPTPLPRWTRLTFLLRASAALAAAVLRPGARPAAAAALASPARVDSLPTTVTRTWVGREYWANRLQDWRLNQGRIECVPAGGTQAVGTLSLLTRALVAGNLPAALSVRTGTLATGTGFSGFLIGAGAGAVNYRAAALAQTASGTGGGFLCTYESDGAVRFREHTSETNQTAYDILPADVTPAPQPPRATDEDVRLDLAIIPLGGALFDVRLSATRVADGVLLAEATRRSVAGAQLIGGIGLISAPTGGSSARYWFTDLSAGGSKIVVKASRALGPIAGVVFSLSGSVLKLTAQLMPVGPGEPQQAKLKYRLPGGTWRAGPTVSLGRGFSATFRITGWDSTQAWEYRVLYGSGTPFAGSYSGLIPKEPTGTELVVAIVSCTSHAFRNLDVNAPFTPRIPGESALGLYTGDNLYFPNAQVVEHLRAHAPDLLVFNGDQFYEDHPTAPDPDPAPELDFLYKWFLWVWSFRDLTKSIPAILLCDDHDVLQKNLWGHDGAPTSDYNLGGYIKSADFVNTLQTVQTAHNPDPYDPTPVLQGIGVYYASFSYGGVSFAILEDRKFKNGDADGKDSSGNPFPPDTLEILGARQEQFLTTWAGERPGAPHVCLMQTVLGSLATGATGKARIDYDTNAYPVPRARDISLLKNAKALAICGDQHLGSLVRHGINTFGDGIVQFAVPSAGTAWQRWFEPAPALPNPEPTPYTGDFTDAFGNKMHVLAVANPPITFADYRRYYPQGQYLGDRRLKRDGYGVLRVGLSASQYVIECWPWNVDPTVPGAKQYPGWPYTLAFSAV